MAGRDFAWYSSADEENAVDDSDRLIGTLAMCHLVESLSKSLSGSWFLVPGSGFCSGFRVPGSVPGSWFLVPGSAVAQPATCSVSAEGGERVPVGSSHTQSAGPPQSSRKIVLVATAGLPVNALITVGLSASIAASTVQALDRGWPVKNHGNAETAETAEQDFLGNSLRALRTPRSNVVFVHTL